MGRHGNPQLNELGVRRAEEIDQVLEVLAEFASPRPTKVGVMFESLLLAYAALRTRHGERCTVLLGQAAYDRAKDSGMLAWCAEHYPELTFEPPSHAVRGYRADQVILDEIAQWEPDKIRSHGG